MDFLNINYLKEGNQKQVKAFEILTRHSILSHIADFDPILVGTIPINIDIESSDLDLICCWQEKQEFIDHLRSSFENEEQFSIRELEIDNNETIVANFKIENFEIEIFGQCIPVKEQNGYKHMVIEHQILEAKGESFRLEVIRLKRIGYKTEPAFGLLLGLSKNPYEELLNYTL